MSQSQVEKLNVLLARVRQRRNEPRLVAVPGAASLPSANTNVATPILKSVESRPALAPIEEVIAPSVPSSLPPPAAPSSIPPPAPISSLPPPAPSLRTPMPPAKPPSSTVPPSTSEQLGRAPTEVLPAAEVGPVAPVRVSPSATVPFDSAVRVTSAARHDAPKSFGELLELSLALRPKAG